MPVHRGEQHRQAVGIEALGDPPRGTKTHVIDECLQLDQERPPALACHRDDAAGLLHQHLQQSEFYAGD